MSTSPSGKLWMGEGTLEVPLELFALNRRRLVERLKPKNLGNAIIVLKGGEEMPFYDTDQNILFRQESYFMWAFGVVEPGFYGALILETGKSILFIPRFDESYAIWYGPLWSTDDFKNKYQVDEVYYTDQIVEILNRNSPSALLTLHGINSDSGLNTHEADFEGIENFKINKEVVFPEITDLRVFKTDFELEVMRYVIHASCEAHCKVMRMARPGKSEYQSEAEFLHHCYSVRGCRFVAYTCICGSGPNSAVLHYGHSAAPNDRFIKEGDMCCYDMGASYFGYAADVTCSFPANGKFSSDQIIIYEAVLKAQRAVSDACKPGVVFRDLYNLANRVMLENLKSGGLLKGNVDDMMAANLGYYFQPHGLGHLLGLDVHDVGGNLNVREKSKLHRLDKLRLTRTLKKGMILTLEPGCYFIDTLLDEALEHPLLSTFLVPEVLNRFRGFGGVRIEDDVYITDNGIENLTKVPRTVEEVELFIAGKDDNKYFNNIKL